MGNPRLFETERSWRSSSFNWSMRRVPSLLLWPGWARAPADVAAAQPGTKAQLDGCDGDFPGPRRRLTGPPGIEADHLDSLLADISKRALVGPWLASIAIISAPQVKP